jgi:hypothetical protein
MKTWITTLAFLTMAATTFAQDARLTSKENAGQGGVYRTSISSGEFYGKLVSYMQSNNEIVRFQTDEIMFRMTRDQDFLKALENLKGFRFENTLEALNVLASHGWEVRAATVVSGRSGDEQHYLMARPVDTMMPVSPWLERRAPANSREK